MQYKTFFQAWDWGMFHEAQGRSFRRLGAFEGDRLVGSVLAALVAARRGTFFMVSHGPLALPGREEEVLRALVPVLRETALRAGASCIRMSPVWPRKEEFEEPFLRLGFRRAPIYGEMESTWRLDISPEPDEIMAGMRKTTRYLVRQALGMKDLEVSVSEDPAGISPFFSLCRDAAQRQKFIPFSEQHLQDEFAALSPRGQAALVLARWKGELAAGALVAFWSGTGFYHHAAMKTGMGKVPAPYLVQWTAILEAKARGCSAYDFWGYVNPKMHPSHPWAGPTLFKMGFGGEAVEYVRTMDLPLSPRYWVTAGFETVRKMRRRL